MKDKQPAGKAEMIFNKDRLLASPGISATPMAPCVNTHCKVFNLQAKHKD